MATSRTGTTAWRRTRALAIRYARRDGIENCPICGTRLDFDQPQTPASAEADHLIPYSKGGRDVISNVQIICRRCKQRKGDGRKQTVIAPTTKEPETRIAW